MSRSQEIGVGLLLVGAAAVLVWMAVQVGALRGPGERVVIDVVMPDAAGLGAGAIASIAGVEVGRVDALRVDFDVARATVSLDATAEVRADARFRVRARSVLGEKYLEIVPQTRDAAPLANGAVVTIDAPQTEIDELVSELGPLVRAVDPAVIRAIVDPIRADPDRPARMLADAEQTLLDLADASARLSSLLDEAEGALRAVRVAAESVPPLVARADTVVTRLDALIASVAPEEVDALVAEILAAVRDGRATIGRVDGISGGLQRLVDRAEAITEEDLLRYTRDEGVLIRFEPRRKLTSPRP